MNWIGVCGCIEWGSMNTPEIISVDNGGQTKWNNNSSNKKKKKSKIKINREQRPRLVISTKTSNTIVVYFTVYLSCWLLSSASSCPSVCFCRWRGGKQTTECVRQSLLVIPAGIDTETQVLNMTGNNLQTLPKEIFQRNGLLNLQKIHLVQCNLNQIDRTAFNRLKNLVELDLRDNLLSTVPSEPLVAIPELRRLLLNGNPIKTVEAKAFTIVPWLVSLEMSNCEIASISDGAFHGLKNLQMLKLNDNKLRTLSAAVLRDTRSVHQFLLEDNPWKCDCQAREFRKYLSNPGIPYYISPQCSEPARLKGFEMDKLSLDDFACPPKHLTATALGELPRDRNNGHVQFSQVQRGGNVTFECKVLADPEAFIHWLYQGRVITNSSSIMGEVGSATVSSEPGSRIYLVDENDIDVDGGDSDAREKVSTLVLDTIEDSDAGHYTCVAENRGGRLLVNFTLEVVTTSVKQEPMVATKGFLMGVIIGLCAFALLVLALVFVLIVRVCHQARKKRRRRLRQNKIPRSETMETKGSSSVYDIQSDNEKRDLQPNNATSNPVQKPPRSFTNATYISTSDISLHDYVGGGGGGNQVSGNAGGKDVTNRHHHHHHHQQQHQVAPQQLTNESLTIAQCHIPGVIFNIKPDIIKCDNGKELSGDTGEYSVPSSRGVSLISNGAGMMILPNGLHDDNAAAAIYQNTGRWSTASAAAASTANNTTGSPVAKCHGCVSGGESSSCLGVPCLHGAGYNGGDNSSDRSYRLATNIRPTASGLAGVADSQEDEEWPRVIPPPLYDTLKRRPSNGPAEWETLPLPPPPPPPPIDGGNSSSSVRVPGIIETSAPPVWEKQSPSNEPGGAIGGGVSKYRPGESKLSPNVYLKQNSASGAGGGGGSSGTSGGLSPFPLLNLSTVRDSPDEGYEDEGEEGTEMSSSSRSTKPKVKLKREKTCPTFI